MQSSLETSAVALVLGIRSQALLALSVQRLVYKSTVMIKCCCKKGQNFKRTLKFFLKSALFDINQSLLSQGHHFSFKSQSITASRNLLLSSQPLFLTRTPNLPEMNISLYLGILSFKIKTTVLCSGTRQTFANNLTFITHLEHVVLGSLNQKGKKQN